MMRLRAIELLEEHGRTRYWLYKQLGMSYSAYHKMITNQTRSIKYENLETMCNLFQCTPNDLIEIVDEEDGEQ